MVDSISSAAQDRAQNTRGATIALAQGFSSLRCERSRRRARPVLRPASTPNMGISHLEQVLAGAQPPAPLAYPAEQALVAPVPAAGVGTGEAIVVPQHGDGAAGLGHPLQHGDRPPQPLLRREVEVALV